MEYNLTIRPEAETDLSEAYQYYEACRENLGADFLLCIEESLERIVKEPHLYQTIYKNIRRVLSRRFPYCIYYITIGKNIIVIAVLHVRKNPANWYNRI